MNRLPNRILLCLLGLCLFACARPTRSNYDKIQNDMTFEDVVSIIGNPTDETSFGAGSLSAKTATWETDDLVIAIQFVNQRVKFKSFSQNTNRNE